MTRCERAPEIYPTVQPRIKVLLLLSVLFSKGVAGVRVAATWLGQEGRESRGLLQAAVNGSVADRHVAPRKAEPLVATSTAKASRGGNFSNGKAPQAAANQWSGCRSVEKIWPRRPRRELHFIHIPRAAGTTIESCSKFFPQG